MMQWRAVLALACAIVWLGVATADTTCDADNGPVKCKVCRTGASINVISGLPRYGSAGSASPYLGSYSWWDCSSDQYTTSANASACEFTTLGGDELASPPAADHPANYISGIGTYMALAILIAIMLPPCAVCCCIWRCFCCCCKGGPCRNGCCGGAAPSPKKCCIGYNRAEARYTACGQWGTRLCMYAFFILVVVFILLGNQNGNTGLTTALKTVVDCPSESVPVVRSTLQPLNTLAKEVFGTTVRRFLIDANDVVQDETNLNVTAAGAACVADGVRTSLPRPDNFIASLDKLDGQVKQINATSNETRTHTDEADRILDRIPGHVDTITGWLVELNASMFEILAEMPPLKADIDDARILSEYVTSTETGAQVLESRLQTISDHYPEDAEWTQAANLAALVATPAGSTDAQRTDLVNTLDSIMSKMGQVTDFLALKSLSESYNARIEGARSRGLFTSLDMDIRRMYSAMEGVPPVYRAYDAVKALEDDVMSINTPAFISALGTFNRTIGPLTDTVKELTAEASRITSALRAIVVCAFDMLDEVRGLNITVIRLPSAFDDVQQLISDANKTLADVDEEIVKVVDTQVGDLDTSVRKQLDKMDSYMEDLNDLDKARAEDVNFTDIYRNLENFNTSLSKFDFNQTLSKLEAINATVSDPSSQISNDTLDALEAIHNVHISERVGRGQAALDEYQTKYCFTSVTVATYSSYAGALLPCTINADCSATDTCQTGAELCMDDAQTRCSASSGCTANCTYEQSSFTALAALTSGLVGSKNTFDITTALTAASEMVNATADLPDFTAITADLNDVETSIVDFPMESSLADLSELRNSTTDDKVDIPGVIQGLNEIDDSMGKLDTAPLRDQVIQFNNTVTDLNDDLDVLDDVKRYSSVVRDFFVHELDIYLAQLERPVLDAVEASGKTSGLFAHVASVGDDILNTVNKAQDDSVIDRNYLADQVNDTLRDALETMEDDTIPTHGWLWFYMKLGGSTGSLIDPTDATAHSVYLDKNNKAYPDDKTCVSKACIEKTIDQYRSEALPDQGGSGDTTLPMSTEQMMLIVFIPMLLLALLACCGAACFCGSETKWQRCPAACSCFCFCINLPLLFLFVGVIFWPLVMVSADLCAGANNVGYDYIAGSSQSLCKDFGGDPISDRICRMELLDEDFDMDIPGLYLSILGECADAPLAVTDFWSSLRRAVNDIPSTNINSTLEDQDPNDELSIQPRMRTVVDQAGVDLGSNLNNTIGAVGDVFSCKSMNSILNGCFDPMCCDFMEAIYWYVSAWYIIGWLMLCCGCPASILGYKRFPNKIWGTHAKEADAEAIVGGAGDGDIEMLNGDEGAVNALYDGEAGDYVGEDEDGYGDGGDDGEYDDYDDYNKGGEEDEF